MRSKAARRVVAGALALAAVVGSAQPAQAWTQPVNVLWSYYAPGPPPGPYQGACIVGTGIWKDGPGDRALITTSRNAISKCRDSPTNSGVSIVTRDPVTGYPSVTGSAAGNLGSAAIAVGAFGHPVIGAHWTAYNDWAAVYWSTTVF